VKNELASTYQTFGTCKSNKYIITTQLPDKGYFAKTGCSTIS